MVVACETFNVSQILAQMEDVNRAPLLENSRAVTLKRANQVEIQAHAQDSEDIEVNRVSPANGRCGQS